MKAPLSQNSILHRFSESKIQIPNYPPGFLSTRLHFDNFLFQKIDRNVADVRENCSIKELHRQDGGIECVLEQNGKISSVVSTENISSNFSLSKYFKNNSSVFKFFNSVL